MDRDNTNKDLFKLKDQAHFRCVFDEYYASLYYYAVKIIENEEVADDIVQDIFLELWKKRDSAYIEKIANYLYSSVRFKCLNHLRHEKVKTNYAKEKTENDDLLPDDSIAMIEEDMIREIHKLIDSMPDQRKNVFQLFLDGYSQNEIASEMNISVNTVKTHKLKARQFLREQLKNSLYILCLVKFDQFL